MSDPLAPNPISIAIGDWSDLLGARCKYGGHKKTGLPFVPNLHKTIDRKRITVVTMGGYLVTRLEKTGKTSDTAPWAISFCAAPVFSLLHCSTALCVMRCVGCSAAKV